MDKYVVDDLLSSTSCDASCDRSSWLDINGLFFDISKNRQKNFTEAYNWQNNKTLVVRRGFSFTLQLTANRLFNSTNHAIIFVFDSGAGRSVADSVQQIQLQSNCNNFDDNTSADWTAELIETDHNVITVEINIPVKCIIGCWTLRIFSGFFEEPDQLTDIHECTDPAFYGNACERKFYLSQTTEMCFTGTKVGSNGYNFTKTPWIHDQFDENTLKTAIFLLSKVARPDNATLTDDRQNIVRVIRKLAYAVKHLFFALGNEPDQSGYISTKQLILKFLNSQQSLPSNESLVQANLYVSLVRSLGICARIVTCIEACYDADPNLTVDRAFVRNSSDFVFEPMKNSAGQLWDCTRTQQFWVECYCSRTDLGVGYDGWQLLDPTAPDSPLTERQAGPAALKSLQNSKLDLPYDARFFCGIYRSNKVLWFYEYDHEIDEYRLLHVRCCKKNGM
ncbi:unnamed protein product [Bursaphelenchus okinawaensis]|uniref:Transglutaminase-like domain-containing protein n=1 Tax=Bursaphelenchus okinawaensis TaxID=465554 RepID=A0A811JR20_9BILA|nr:unnamed protein product [Bursaphelenchus okinawaensis]CAG9078479.1 unnamed protein product [Bursaphelenchus okinawaensis]